ncbi:unnamed protein product, partial [Ceratitis capitata]
ISNAYPNSHIGKELKCFQVMLNFYRRFLPNALEHQTTRQLFIGTEATKSNFAAYKSQLAKCAMLAHPLPNAA